MKNYARSARALLVPRAPVFKHGQVKLFVTDKKTILTG
jgi:hypothetical protein